MIEISVHVFTIIVEKLDKNPALGFLIVSMMFNAFQYREKNILTEKIFGLLSRFKIKSPTPVKEITPHETKLEQSPASKELQFTGNKGES